jgi:hypothetical protein
MNRCAVSVPSTESTGQRIAAARSGPKSPPHDVGQFGFEERRRVLVCLGDAAGHGVLDLVPPCRVADQRENSVRRAGDISVFVARHEWSDGVEEVGTGRNADHRWFEKGEWRDPRGVPGGQLERDDGAERMLHDVGTVDAHVVEQGARIFGLLGDRCRHSPDRARAVPASRRVVPWSTPSTALAG